jgi:hypothetical protein
MKINVFLITVLVTILLVACSKNRLESTDDGTIEPPKISTLVVPATFNWSTGKTITVNIVGLPTLLPVKSTLTIGLKDGTQLYKNFQDMSQSFRIIVTIPAIENSLRLKYGTVTYDFPITGDKADFSFIPTIQDKDI